MSRFLIPAAIFLALAGVLYVGVVHSPNKSTMQSALLGKTVPDFSLPVLDNPGMNLTNTQLAGRPWVLNVWGTWCAACRDEHPVLLDIAKQNVLPLVGLDWKDEDDAALEWLKQLGNPYSVVVADRDGRTAINFGVYGAPETFFIDADGRVQYRHVGAMTAEVWQREFLSRLPRGGLP
ncbi:MAG TPA: DsbE family thiol:disulfide interchange protein [Steroidobacteraceae bacterium]|nr:DsbE family thiol:disulfide interchange protein [Steroidobacteraceae bacterium]